MKVLGNLTERSNSRSSSRLFAQTEGRKEGCSLCQCHFSLRSHAESRHTQSLPPCLLGAPPMTPRPSPPLASPSLRVSAPPRALRPPFRRSPVFGEFYIHRATFRSARIRARALYSTALRHKRGETNGRSSVVTRNLGLHARDLPGDPAHSRPFGDPRSPPIPTKNPKQKPELTFALLSSQSTSSVRAPPATAVRSSPPPTPTK